MSLTPFFIDPFYSPSAGGHRHPRSDRSQNHSALQQLFSGGAIPAVDVYEEQDKFVVEAEVPGVKKENLDIHIGDNGKSVTISGKTVSRRSWKTGTIEEDNSNAEKNTTANDKNGQAVQKKGDGKLNSLLAKDYGAKFILRSSLANHIF